MRASASPKHRAADVTDVHRFRDVGRSEINHDPSRRFCLCNAEPFVSQNLARFSCDGIGAQCEVDEACASDRGRLAKIANIKLGENFCRQSFRVFAALFPEDQSGIGLIIAETRIGRRRQFARIRKARLCQRIGKSLCQE